MRKGKNLEPSDDYFLVALLMFIVQWNLPPELNLKHLELNDYVLGGPYLSFINYKGNSFRFWWSVPRFPELWEITYVFGGFTLLLFIL